MRYYFKSFLLIFTLISTQFFSQSNSLQNENKIEITYRFRDGFSHGERISFTVSNFHTTDSLIYDQELLLIPNNPYPTFAFLLPVNQINTIKLILYDREISYEQSYILSECPLFIEVFINLKNELNFYYSDKLIEIE